MRYYPVNLDVRNRDCLVVGGGRVGERKTKSLLDYGAKVTVVSPDATESVRAMGSRGHITLQLRDYQPSDLDGRFLVIGATDNDGINQKISRDAARQRILCNIADRPEASTFVLPAVIRQGDLVIAISTSNKSPAVARRIRQTLEKDFGPEYAILLNLMGSIRQRLLAEAKSPETRKWMFERLLDKGLLETIREDRKQDVDLLLSDVLGEGYTWEKLMSAEQVHSGPGSIKNS